MQEMTRSKKSPISQAVVAALGVTAGRVIVDVFVEPQSIQDIIRFALIAFCLGFLIWFGKEPQVVVFTNWIIIPIAVPGTTP